MIVAIVLTVLPGSIVTAYRAAPDPPDRVSIAVRSDLLWADRHGMLDGRPLSEVLAGRWRDDTVEVEVVLGDPPQKVPLEVTALADDVVEVRWTPPADSPGRRPPDVVCFTRDASGRLDAVEASCP